MMKRSKLLALLALAALLMPMNVKAQTTNTPLTEGRLRWKSQRLGELRYLLSLPKDYNSKRGQRWPLMLFLHGSGERGTNLHLVTIHGPPKLAQQGKEFPFILVAPQCPAGQLWENEPLLQLLDQVIAKYAVDTNRVYLTGLSMGGFGTWRLGLTHPERFAALAPVCGGASFLDLFLGVSEKGAVLKNLPIWAFHGAKDSAVPVEESERLIKALQKAGAKEVKLTVYPEAGHDSWTKTYNDPELYEWLLSKRRANDGARK